MEDFLDEDELEDMRKSGLQVRAEYDTFGTTAAEHARRAANAEASTRDRGHLSFVPDAIITPVADSMGEESMLTLCKSTCVRLKEHYSRALFSIAWMPFLRFAPCWLSSISCK